MPPVFPSVQMVREWRTAVLQEAAVAAAIETQLIRQLHDVDPTDTTAVDAFFANVAQATRASEALQNQLVATLWTFERGAPSVRMDPRLDILPDLETLVTREQVLIVGACLRIWGFRMMQWALVPHVLERLIALTQDQHSTMSHRRAARNLLTTLTTLPVPSLKSGGPLSVEWGALIWLSDLLIASKAAEEAVQTLARETHGSVALVQGLHAVFSDIPASVLQGFVKHIGNTRPAQLLHACLSHHYPEASPETIRRCLRLANHINDVTGFLDKLQRHSSTGNPHEKRSIPVRKHAPSIPIGNAANGVG